MLHFTPITATLLAAALQTSGDAPAPGAHTEGAPRSGAPASAASSAGAQTPVAVSVADRLARALAEWELYAATSGEDPKVATTLDALVQEARDAVAAAPTDAGLVRSAEAIEAARARFRTERGLERPAEGLDGRSEQDARDSRDPRTSDEAVIASVILGHLIAEPSEGRQEAILRFGPRAVPQLVASARGMSAASALGAPSIALDTLAIIDPLKALEASWDLSAQPSFLVHQSVARVLSRRMVYTYDDVWVAREGGDHVPAAPEWGQLVERLLSEPAVAPEDMRNLLEACAARGYAPQVVVDAILSLDDIGAWPQLSFVPPGTRPLYIAGLQHPRVDVRRHCADKVSEFPDPTPLFALHSDRDVHVRQAVANALGARAIVVSGPPLDAVKRTVVPPVPGPEHQAALEHCLSDENASISRAGARAVTLTYNDREISLLPPADLARLATTVRDSEVKLQLLMVLLEDAPELLASVAERTLSDSALRASGKTYLEAYNTFLYFDSSAEHAPAIATAVLAALEAHATPKEWAAIFEQGYSWAKPPGLLVHLSDDLRVRLVQSLARHAPSVAWWLRKWVNKVPHETEPWRALMLDQSASILARALAIPWALGNERPSPEHVSAIMDAIRALARESAAPTMDWESVADWIGEILDSLDSLGVPTQSFLSAMFVDQSVRDEVLLEMRLDLNRGTDEERAELARAVLARFPVESWAGKSLFLDILFLAHTLAPEERVELIEDALARRWDVHALDAASRLRDPELLETLRRYTQQFEEVDLVRVAKTAASFLSDDAAKLILELAARTSDSEARAQILASLQQVVDYQTALAKWQQRNDATAVRVRAIAELVAVIDDPSAPEAQRVEALRGLGLLGAVEELPRLVRTLSAPSEALRTAAREALDRLNAAPVK